MELLQALAAGRTTVRDAVGERLALLHAMPDAVMAFDDDRALADATRLDRAFSSDGPVGPLHGLPVTIKDWIDVEGFPCAGETDSLDRRPARDATVVARLRAAGAVVLAKSKVWRGVRHPLDASRTIGGSSSGEAALIGAGASVAGLGSDSGGSIRTPAAWAGIHGLRPTTGRVPLTGHFPRVGALNDGRTVIGPMSADLSLVSAMLDVIAGPDGQDPGVPPVPPQSPPPVVGLRVAHAFGDLASPAVAAAVSRVAVRLVGAGAVPVEWPYSWLDEAMEITRGYWDRATGRPDLTGADVDRQLRDWDRFRIRALRAMASVDVLVMPTMAGPAPVYRDLVGDDFLFTAPASLTGGPALTVPAGVEDGLPIGVQLVGRPWEDHVVLAAGRVAADDPPAAPHPGPGRGPG